jgi:hypothetical protein
VSLNGKERETVHVIGYQHDFRRTRHSVLDIGLPVAFLACSETTFRALCFQCFPVTRIPSPEAEPVTDSTPRDYPPGDSPE